ncbi:hypothetical protein HGRIS_001556 [Hohenbuehelia grisea]|uniref:Uncharacterized protein n=1 Tax=Hohenbuehelia grisea TaxID=104357 RepID=A0ABR3JPN0_9AGAR
MGNRNKRGDESKSLLAALTSQHLLWDTPLNLDLTAGITTVRLAIVSRVDPSAFTLSLIVVTLKLTGLDVDGGGPPTHATSVPKRGGDDENRRRVVEVQIRYRDEQDFEEARDVRNTGGVQTIDVGAELWQYRNVGVSRLSPPLSRAVFSLRLFDGLKVVP